VSDSLRFSAIAAGYDHVCALEVAGGTWCWGSNEHGQLGSGAPMEACVSAQYACSSTPVRVEGGRQFTLLAASIRHTCGLDAAGAAFCWGFGLGGQLGDGSRTNSTAPLPVAGGLRFASLTGSAASGSTCGLTPGGDAWCWGINTGGVLGNGMNKESSFVPSPLATSSKLVGVSLGDQHGCALDAGGNALCWGSNWFGQLGVGSSGGANGIAESLAPVAVLGGLKFREIVAAGMHSCGLQESGAAHCWGAGPQLGAGAGPVYASLPLPVVLAGSRWVSLGRGYAQTCARDEIGALYCWGHATSLEPLVYAELPTRIDSAQPFGAFALGGTHACALGADGFAYCWGGNRWGQVGRPASDP
jgi:alpha-tubulin suppressor-like RCC1 family protein